jgi:hypothetical protein
MSRTHSFKLLKNGWRVLSERAKTIVAATTAATKNTAVSTIIAFEEKSLTAHPQR